MGLAIDRTDFSPNDYEAFNEQLKGNLNALDQLLSRPSFGVGPRSIGAELEIYIIDDQAKVLPINTLLQEESKDPQLTLELNKFNLEYNFTPAPIAAQPFLCIEQEMQQKLSAISQLAKKHNGRIIPIGILPTLSPSDFGLHAMTDTPRYHALTQGLQKMRGGPFNVNINGLDYLSLSADDVTLEGANTSFQVHYRVLPSQFVDTFNALQLITPIVLALSANSPLLMGRRLWHETRISLFKQSVDSRKIEIGKWHQPARVAFGQGWVRHSAFELFAEAVNLYPPILPVIGDEDAMGKVEQGLCPELHELRLHYSTVWPWNRPVYDPAEGGHLRIEMRTLPAGPTSLDMSANAAFMIGLAEGIKPMVNKILPALPFQYAEYNFYRAAQKGVFANIIWPKENQLQLAESSILGLAKRLMPLAYQGLASIGLSNEESKRLLTVIEDRIEAQMTGAIWQLQLFEKLKQQHSVPETLTQVVERYIEEYNRDVPVAHWSLDI